MNRFKQLTPEEVLFVCGETATVYQHTAGLIMMEAGNKAHLDFDAFKRHTAERLATIPQFRWKLHEVPFGLDLPYWVEDEKFSLDHHIRRIAVPSPGDREALGEVASHLYCKHLDRNRPLWKLWYIEGLAGGKSALLQKMHHCMMDGEGASKLGEIIWDFEPTGAHKEVDPAIAKAESGEVPEQWRLSLNAARRLASLPLKISQEVFGGLRHMVSQQLGRRGKTAKRPGAPRASFNADISSARRFVFGSLPLADVMAIKNQFGVSVNDVVLALVGTSLRAYLLARGEVLDASLRTSIAISLRKQGDDDFSNKVTVAAVTLATDTADPVSRLKAIHEESVAAKQEAHSGGKGVLEFMQMLPTLLVNTMVRIAPADKIAEVMGVNVVVSSVRGSPTPMYIAGERISAVYPMSIISPGGGINITCFSYGGGIHFGCTLEPDLVPNPWWIVDGLDKALTEYSALLKKSPGRASKTGGKSSNSKANRAAAKPKSVPKRATASRKKAKPKNTSASHKR